MSSEESERPARRTDRHLRLSIRISAAEVAAVWRAARTAQQPLATFIRACALAASEPLPIELTHMKPNQIQPCGPNVLIRRKKTEAQSKGGIVLPESQRETTIYCEVLAVGDEVKRAEPGDTAVVVPQAGIELDVDDMAVIAERDVLALVAKARKGGKGKAA